MSRVWKNQWREKMDELTSTGSQYEMQFKQYKKWIDTTNMQALPITPPKAALWVLASMKRRKLKKVGDQWVEMEGTVIGRTMIKQVSVSVYSTFIYIRVRFMDSQYLYFLKGISALERYRGRMERFFDREKQPLAYINLRSHPSVHNVEKLLAPHELTRLNTNSSAKASGALANRYTTQDRKALASYYIQQSTTQSLLKSVKATRDAGMQKIAYAYCFRGDNVRRLCLSDIQIYTLDSTFNRPSLDVNIQNFSSIMLGTGSMNLKTLQFFSFNSRSSFCFQTKEKSIKTGG